jgi:type IV pilus assembly protein PilA
MRFAFVCLGVVSSKVFPKGVVQMNRKGFTLIELLIVVVIIGILAAIAIPKFANTKEKAYIASMKSDLRNLITAEEAYFADSVKYSATIGAGGIIFVQSTGNTAPTINLTADGWTANIKNVNTTKTCSVYIGSTALAPAVKEGEAKCQ